jgi:hypothetical protein
VAYGTQQARQDLLDSVAEAADDLGVALAALGGAFELLDDNTAERLEEQLFRPVQAAYGRAKRTHAGFAARHGLPARAFPAATAGPPSQGVKGYLDHAVDAVQRADDTLAELQDSMLPVEVGDPELRAGLAEVREHAGTTRSRAQQLIRTLGR